VRRGVDPSKRLDTTLGETRTLLVKYPSTRDNDLLLGLTYLQEYMGVKFEPLTESQLRRGGVLGSVFRARRKIQNDHGVLLPNSPEVRAQRKIKEEVYREWAIKDKTRDS